MYQYTFSKRGTTLCTYLPLPSTQNSVLIPSPILVILCTNLSYPNEVLHYVHISLLQLKQNCILIPCPTLVILCTNLPYPNEIPHYVHISLLQLKQNCILIPSQILVILCTNLSYPNEVLHYVHISLLQLKQNCVLLSCPTLLIFVPIYPTPRGTTLSTYFPAPIEPKLCTFTMPNITNIVYQSTLPNRVTTLCTYFYLPLNQNWVLLSRPT